LKLSKTSWLILAAGIFVVLIAGLIVTRSKQLQEQSQLRDELRIAEMRLNKLQVEQLKQQGEGLQEKLEASAIQLKAARENLRQTVESIEVTDKFFAIAQSCDVEVTRISSSEIKGDSVAGVDCSMITLNAVAEGEVPNLISFVIKLNNDFTTGIVDSAKITMPG
jgi:3-polyprenyl-4-hydroxybenzoate decarboxylase